MGARVAADHAAQRLDRADASQGPWCCFGVGGRSSAAEKQRHDSSFFFLLLLMIFFFSLAVYSSPSLIPCVVHHLRDDTRSAASHQAGVGRLAGRGRRPGI